MVFSPVRAPLDAIQTAADAEFPGVANVYVDRLGRLCVHGRLAKFDPVGTSRVLERPVGVQPLARRRRRRRQRRPVERRRICAGSASTVASRR